MRNKELVDKRFTQIEAKMALLNYQLGGQSSTKDFKETLRDLGNIVEDLKSIIERDLDAMRNG
jgi:hypothetical protein|tara:strand:- start:180 stop:368 length:189 start_codon:yes stop_codon:yes gene_type:complete